jgi:hypothetical protein
MLIRMGDEHFEQASRCRHSITYRFEKRVAAVSVLDLQDAATSHPSSGVNRVAHLLIERFIEHG